MPGVAEPGENRPFPTRLVAVTLAAGLALGIPLVLWLAPSASERAATPAELLQAIAGFPEDPDAVPPFRAAAQLEPTSFLQLAQGDRQTFAGAHIHVQHFALFIKGRQTTSAVGADGQLMAGKLKK